MADRMSFRFGTHALPMADIARGWVASRLSPQAFRCGNEAELQKAIHDLLRKDLGLFGMIGREVPLSATDRIDFLIPTEDGGLGIEVKVDGSTSAVARQLQRYAESDRVTELLLLTTLRRHAPLDGTTLAGKPVHVLRLKGGFL